MSIIIFLTITVKCLIRKKVTLCNYLVRILIDLNASCSVVDS